MEPIKEYRPRIELAEWLDRMRDGSPEAFDRFYESAAPFICGIARKLLGDRMEAEDVCHDVLLAVISEPARYDPSRGSVEAWLAVLTKSKCVDRLRKRSKIVLEPEEPASSVLESPGQTEQRALRKLERDALRRALGELPGAQRRTIAAAFYDYRSQRDLANEWQVPVGTVKSRVRYGLNHLRKAMERMGWGEKGGERDG